MAKLGLVDETSGTLSSVSDAAATMVAADTAQAIRDAIGLGNAAIEDVTAFANADQGSRADVAHGWGDHAAVGYVAATDNALPAIDGANLTRLPTAWGGYTESAASVANSTAEAAVATLTIPAGLLSRTGERVKLRCYAQLLSNLSPSSTWTLRAKLDGTAIWGDSSQTSENANPSLMLLEIEIQRIGDTSALVLGLVRWNFPSAPAEGVGIGEIGATARRVLDWSADNPVTVDWAEEIVLSFTVQMGVADNNLAWTGLFDLIESNVTGAYEAPQPPTPPPSETRDWMETQYPTSPFTRTLTVAALSASFPKVSTGNWKQNLTAAQLACFDACFTKPFRGSLIASAQAINSNLQFGRIFHPCEYLGYADDPTKTWSGPQFTSSGASTDCDTGVVFPGHWLYKPYTTLAQAIGTGAGTYSVANASLISTGQYVVIYAAGNWAQGEHAYVSARDTVNNTVTLSVRGYKSTARSFSSGARIATHQLGNGGDARCWSYNMSTQCPTDGNGARINALRAAWLVDNYDLDGNGNSQPCTTHGIWYDSDFQHFADGGAFSARNCDADNDGAADYGISSAGVNWWGDGVDAFYQGVRDGLDARGGAHANKWQTGGDGKTFGMASLNGAQIEAGFDDVYDESGATATGNYSRVHRYLSLAHLHGNHTIGPRMSEVENKIATAAYPGTSGATSNAGMRFSMALAWCFDNHIANQNGFDDAFHWFDEYAVDLTPGADYGKAIARTDTTNILANQKWLGEPLGPYTRIYAPDLFDAADAVFDADFEAGITGWSGSKSAVAQSSEQAYEGTYSLKITPNSGISQIYIYDAYAIGPSFQLSAGTDYSVCFAVYCANPRKLQVRFGNNTSEFLYIPAGWSKQVWSLRYPATESQGLRFDCAVDQDPVYIDQIKVFAQPGNIFRRDFDNGIVVANASAVQVTVDLGGTYQRILGTQSAVNDGSSVTQLTLPAWDAAVLVNAPA